MQQAREDLHRRAVLLRKEIAARRAKQRGRVGSARLPTMPNTNASGAGFLRSELRTGMTLTRIAMQSVHPDRVDRNRANAKKAYDSVLRFLPKAQLGNEEEMEIRDGLAELKFALQSLGEKV